MAKSAVSNRPISNSYWVRPGELLAGEYPAGTGLRIEMRLQKFLEHGVDHFVDLTEPYEYIPYRDKLVQLARSTGVEVAHLRFGIPDMSVPRNRRYMKAILDNIDAALAEGRRVYVHCLGGIGRTGTVIGCHLVRHGLGGEPALERLQQLWLQMEKSRWFPHTPQTAAQFEFIRRWPEAGAREGEEAAG